jgi:hypothetical protein
MFGTRAPLETSTARVMRLETEERILSFIMNNSIRSNSFMNNETDNRNTSSSNAEASNYSNTADTAPAPGYTATASITTDSNPHED